MAEGDKKTTKKTTTKRVSKTSTTATNAAQDEVTIKPRVKRAKKTTSGATKVERPSVFREFTEEEEFASKIDMNKVRSGVRRHILMVLICGVIFAFGGGVATYILRKTYSADAFLVYQQERPERLAGTYTLSKFSLPTVVQMMRLPMHYKAVKSILGLNIPIEDLDEMVEIENPHNKSNLIKVSCVGKNPTLVVNVANTLSSVIVKHSEELSRKQLQMAHDYFFSQQKSANARLDAQDKALAGFKSENPHFELSSGHSTLIDSAAKARAEYQNSALAYNTLLVEFENLQREAANVPEHTVKYAYEESPLKDRIQQTEMALLEARTRYAPDNPKVKILETSLGELRKMLSEVSMDDRQGKVYEKNPLKEQLNVELMRLQGKLRSSQKLKEDLQESMVLAEQELETLPQDQIQYAKLMHKKAAAQDEIKQLANAVRSTELLLKLGKGDVDVYHRADTAQAYSSKWDNYVNFFPLVGFILGCFFGLGLAAIVEALDRKVCTEKQVELSYTAPCLQIVPDIRGLARKDSEGALLFYIRSLSERVESSIGAEGFSSVAFTSSVAGEGKSALAYHFARYYAERRGQKVVFVEFDPRSNPFVSMTKKKGKKEENLPCIEQYLNGTATLTDITKKGSVDCIKAGFDPNMNELVISDKMKALWSELNKKYDLVVMETPTVIDDTYASNLLRFTDLCVFVVASSKVTKPVIDSALHELESKNIHADGIVLNRVQPTYVNDARIQKERKRLRRQYWKNILSSNKKK